MRVSLFFAIIFAAISVLDAFSQTSNSSVTVSVRDGVFRVNALVANDSEKKTLEDILRAKLPVETMISVTIGKETRSFDKNWKTEFTKQIDAVRNWKSGIFVFRSPHRPDELSDTLRESEFTLLDGTTTKLGDHDDKVVVIVLMATWCQPCRVQLDSVGGLLNLRPMGEAEVIALTVDNDSREDLKQFARRFKSFKFGWSSDELTSDVISMAGMRGVPITFVVREGRLVLITRGATPGGDPAFRAFLDREYPRK